MAMDLETTDASVPDDIEKRVAEIMREHPTLRWDAAVKEVQADANDNNDG